MTGQAAGTSQASIDETKASIGAIRMGVEGTASSTSARGVVSPTGGSATTCAETPVQNTPMAPVSSLRNALLPIGWRLAPAANPCPPEDDRYGFGAAGAGAGAGVAGAGGVEGGVSTPLVASRSSLSRLLRVASSSAS